MRLLLILLIAGCHDIPPVQVGIARERMVSYLNEKGGDSPSPDKMSGTGGPHDAELPPPVVSSLPGVYMYSPSWCSVCSVYERVYRDGDYPFELRVKKWEPEFPDWVRKCEVFPVIHYESRELTQWARTDPVMLLQDRRFPSTDDAAREVWRLVGERVVP